MQGDPSLTDDDLQGEIDLVGALVLAASDAEGPMTQASIDEVLGVGDEDGLGGEALHATDAGGDAGPADGAPDGAAGA